LPLQESVQTTRTIVLKGVNARLAVGDYVLTVEGEHTPNEDPTLYQISSVSVDKAGNTTSITWQETAGAIYRQTTDNPVTLYVLRAHASPFASAAPNWYTLSPTLTATQPSSGLAVGKASSSGTGTDVPPYTNWEVPANDAAYMPAGGFIALDGVYDAAQAT